MLYKVLLYASMYIVFDKEKAHTLQCDQKGQKCSLVPKKISRWTIGWCRILYIPGGALHDIIYIGHMCIVYIYLCINNTIYYSRYISLQMPIMLVHDDPSGFTIVYNNNICVYKMRVLSVLCLWCWKLYVV